MEKVHVFGPLSVIDLDSWNLEDHIASGVHSEDDACVLFR